MTTITPDVLGVLGEFLRTEKSTQWLEPHRQYCFRVALTANKHQIKEAVEAAFKVKVTQVRTMRQEGKLRRLRRDQGQRSNWKKAVVTLAEGHKIEMT